MWEQTEKNERNKVEDKNYYYYYYYYNYYYYN